MLIIGAKGHALEVMQCLSAAEREDIVFFDNVTTDLPNRLFGTYPLLRTETDVRAYFTQEDNRFVIGIGGPMLRNKLANQFLTWGGELTSVIAATAVIGPKTKLGKGLNIMHHTLVAPLANLGDGVLLNAGAAVHHDAIIGSYCEISPGARILGRCHVGHGCRIGAGAIILPDIVVGDGATIGAGAVVTRPVENYTTVVGVPARVVNL